MLSHARSYAPPYARARPTLAPMLDLCPSYALLCSLLCFPMLVPRRPRPFPLIAPTKHLRPTHTRAPSSVLTRVSYAFSPPFLCISYAFPMLFPCFSYAFPILSPMLSARWFPMRSLCESRRFPSEILRFPMRFLARFRLLSVLGHAPLRASPCGVSRACACVGETSRTAKPARYCADAAAASAHSRTPTRNAAIIIIL